MEYQFIRQEPCREKVLFVLTLDRKKLKERVLIGTESEIRSQLEGDANVDLFYDSVSPLGTMLIRFDKDADGSWNRLGLSPLRDAMHTSRWEQPALEQAAGQFLSEKYQSGEPGPPVHSVPHLERLSESPGETEKGDRLRRIHGGDSKADHRIPDPRCHAV